MHEGGIDFDHEHSCKQGRSHIALSEGAVLGVRPKAMILTVIVAGFLPIMWGSGTGSEVMRRVIRKPRMNRAHADIDTRAR